MVDTISKSIVRCFSCFHDLFGGTVKYFLADRSFPPTLTSISSAAKPANSEMPSTASDLLPSAVEVLDVHVTLEHTGRADDHVHIDGQLLENIHRKLFLPSHLNMSFKTHIIRRIGSE